MTALRNDTEQPKVTKALHYLPVSIITLQTVKLASSNSIVSRIIHLLDAQKSQERVRCLRPDSQSNPNSSPRTPSISYSDARARAGSTTGGVGKGRRCCDSDMSQTTYPDNQADKSHILNKSWVKTLSICKPARRASFSL